MAQQIVLIEQMGDALRNTGYKSIENAISEIVDNSIEAEAKDIFVLVSESVDDITHRKYVSEFAFLDNGTGMDLAKLESCLGIGFTTRSSRQGIGRFGVGLPQASLHVCPAVDVYSWQNGYDNCHKVYLDIDLVRSGEQTQIDDPQKASIPSKFERFLTYNTGIKTYDFTQKGTLVHWKKCDRVSPKTVRSLFQRLEFALGQKFRYLIKESTHNIRLIHIENEDFSSDVMPNDPMMLMTPNYVLGNPEKPEVALYKTTDANAAAIFEPYATEDYPDGVIKIPVEYQDKDTREKKTTTVDVAFSKVKDIFYDKTAFPAKDPGALEIGKHVAKLEGISVVRADREIDFGMFDFYKNINEPQHRWWGCEIRFNPVLDEAFGVSNNKQHVELREVKPEDYDESEIKPIWLQLTPVISRTIAQIYKQNKETRAKSRTVEDIVTPATEIVNTVEENNDTESQTENIRKETPPEQLIEKTKEILTEQGVDDVTDDAAIKYLKNKVNIYYKDLRSGGPFFDISFSFGICQVDINTSHIYYKTFFPHIEANPETKTAFELFLAAFVMSVNENAIGDKMELADVIIQEWNTKLRRYINEQTNYGK